MENHSTDNKKKKVVLAFSGGLDTSFAAMYLSKDLGYEVHTAIANTGGFSDEELKRIEERAMALGAASHATLDVTDDYYNRSIRYMIAGNVLRNGTYPISVSSERIFQAIAIIEYAKKIGPTPWPTARPAQATIRCVSTSHSRSSLPRSRSSPPRAT